MPGRQSAEITANLILADLNDRFALGYCRRQALLALKPKTAWLAGGNIQAARRVFLARTLARNARVDPGAQAKSAKKYAPS